MFDPAEKRRTVNVQREIAMSGNENDDKKLPADGEACDETVAGEEELYLEETEEEVSAVLISYDVSRSRNDCSTGPEDGIFDWEQAALSESNSDLTVAESLDDQLIRAAEELITGDADDPPLSEKVVMEMIRAALDARLLGSIGFAS